MERLCQQVRLSRVTVDAIRDAADRLLEQRATGRVELERQLRQDEAELIQREMQLTAAFTAGDLASNLYKLRTAEVRQKRTALQSRRTEAAVDPQELAAKVGRILQAANSLRDLYDSLSDVRRAELLREVFCAIVVSADGIVGFTLRPPFDRLIASQEQGTLSDDDSMAVAEAMIAA